MKKTRENSIVDNYFINLSSTNYFFNPPHFKYIMEFFVNPFGLEPIIMIFLSNPIYLTSTNQKFSIQKDHYPTINIATHKLYKIS